jgi:glutamate-1-semialdehyde 2,1-aminomutase
LADGINTFCKSHNLPVQVLNAGSMFQVYFTDQTIRTARDLPRQKTAAETAFYLHLLDLGILIPGTRRSFVSAAHTPEIIDEAIDRICAALQRVQDEGLFS